MTEIMRTLQNMSKERRKKKADASHLSGLRFWKFVNCFICMHWIDSDLFIFMNYVWIVTRTLTGSVLVIAAELKNGWNISENSLWIIYSLLQGRYNFTIIHRDIGLFIRKIVLFSLFFRGNVICVMHGTQCADCWQWRQKRWHIINSFQIV